MPMNRKYNKAMPQTTLQVMMTGSATLTSSKRVGRETMILGTLTRGFNKAKSKQRLLLISHQISLLYLPLLQVL